MGDGTRGGLLQGRRHSAARSRPLRRRENGEGLWAGLRRLGFSGEVGQESTSSTNGSESSLSSREFRPEPLPVPPLASPESVVLLSGPVPPPRASAELPREGFWLPLWRLWRSRPVPGCMKGWLKNSSKEMRSTGLRRRRCLMRLLQSEERLTATPSGRRASVRSMFRSSITWFAPPKGGRPVTSSNRIVPTLQRSAFASYFWNWRISGAM
mmetsp:Transcript_13006/g.27492  ORF Transcript_13006/g.27492 Transcript_13006/m.27492 type:complete len:211 (-) Transcript_13006:928-1560(-)